MSDVGGRRADKARDVREMFGAIASRYDFLNHFLSGNIDRLWRRTFMREVSIRLTSPRPAILDVGCGTADLSLKFSSLGPVTGCDFCHPMLCIGRDKIFRRQPLHPIALLEADALALPFPAGGFDVVVSAFVLRNLADVQRGLREMRRVLRGGGVLGVLDFCMPKIPIMGRLYRFYFFRILPKLGSMISGVNGPYTYLPESVRAFPGPEELKTLIVEAGFEQVEYRLFSGGIAVLMLARAPMALARNE
jgi:demethylmenaquinone methyltransferase / 2-methoxy-6-polyprenyl-1,4-benzoquinol methylase